MSEWRIESDAILDTGGGVAKALPYFDGEPFFAQNSDSLWVEGMGQAFGRMRERWNPDEMDSLMLLAPAEAYDITKSAPARCKVETFRS